MKALWLPLGLIALLTPALASADYFRYETDEGVVSFTDDLKQIPSRYKDAAEPISEQSLVNYRRVTIVPRGASNTAAPTSFERSSLDTSTEPTRAAQSRVQISSNPSTTRFELPAGTRPPTHIERYTEWRWVDGRYVPHTVVEKDGQVISVVRLR